MQVKRISQHVWRDIIDERTRNQIRDIATRYACDFGYDFEFEYIWITFTDENYLLARIASEGLL